MDKHFYVVVHVGYILVLKECIKDNLMAKINSIAFRATKSECLDSPEAKEFIRYIKLEPKAMNICKSFVKDSFAKLNKAKVTGTNVLTKLLRLSQLTGKFLGIDENTSY